MITIQSSDPVALRSPHRDVSDIKPGPGTEQRLIGLQQKLPIFITATRESVNGRPDDQSQMLVRCHVASRYCRETLVQRAPMQPELASGGSTGKFKLASWSFKGGRKANKEKPVNLSEHSVQGGRGSYKSRPKRSSRGKQRIDNLESETDILLGVQSCEISGCPCASWGKAAPFNIPRVPPGAGPIDPFATTSLPLGYQMQGLIHHYLWVYPVSVHPLKFYKYHSQNFIFSMAVTDQALLHAIIALSGIHKFCFGTDVSEAEKISILDGDPVILYHRMMAMKLVSMKLEVNDVSDATITAALILSMHHPWIERTETNMHYSGLKKMLHFRGGLDNISPALAGAIRFHDLKRSTLNCVGPFFAGKSLKIGISDFIAPVLSGDSMFCHSQTYLKSVLGEDLWQILYDLHYLTCFVDYYRSRPGEFRQRESNLFEAWNSSIEHRLLSYLASSTNDKFRESLCTAAILWISTAVWNWPLNTSMVMSTVDHLVKTLRHSDLGSWREKFPEIFIWILVVGACCNPNETLLLHQLRTLCRLQGWGSQNDLECILRDFIYTEAYATALASLWRDISQP